MIGAPSFGGDSTPVASTDVNEIRRYRLRHRARPLDVLVCGDGRPLLLLHGWGLSGRAYRRAMLALADRGFRVIAPSLAVNDTWSIEAAAGASAEALAGVDASEAIVVGHSFGGAIGVRLALEHPDFVSALIAVNSPLVSLGNRGLGRILLPGPHYRIVSHGGAAASLLLNASSRAGLSSLARSVRWFFGNHHAEALQTLAATDLPRVVLWAQADTLLPAEVGRRAAEILGCDFVVIGPDETWTSKQRSPDHDWPFRHPTHFADTITRHVAELTGRTAEEAG